MPRIYRKFVLLVGLMACGARNDVSRLQAESIDPDNSPLRTECLGVNGIAQQPVPVEWDDQSDLRVCLVLQKDGALGFDLRLRTDSTEVKRRAAAIELRSPDGSSVAANFPLLWNPYSGVYELQLSQGCLVGQPGGCSQLAPTAMRDMFRSLARTEADWRPSVQMQLSLVTGEAKVKNQLGQKLANSSRKFILNWPTAPLRNESKTIN